jgi:hypothetical protein
MAVLLRVTGIRRVFRIIKKKILLKIVICTLDCLLWSSKSTAKSMSAGIITKFTKIITNGWK